MLPYASAKSDLLRAALLYHHGDPFWSFHWGWVVLGHARSPRPSPLRAPSTTTLPPHPPRESVLSPPPKILTKHVLQTCHTFQQLRKISKNIEKTSKRKQIVYEHKLNFPKNKNKQFYYKLIGSGGNGTGL